MISSPNARLDQNGEISIGYYDREVESSRDRVGVPSRKKMPSQYIDIEVLYRERIERDVQGYDSRL